MNNPFSGHAFRRLMPFLASPNSSGNGDGFFEAERDLHKPDLLRPQLAKVFGKGAGLDALKEAMTGRYSRKRQPSPVATA
jgi:hypothetical protein